MIGSFIACSQSRICTLASEARTCVILPLCESFFQNLDTIFAFKTLLHQHTFPQANVKLLVWNFHSFLAVKISPHLFIISALINTCEPNLCSSTSHHCYPFLDIVCHLKMPLHFVKYCQCISVTIFQSVLLLLMGNYFRVGKYAMPFNNLQRLPWLIQCQ